MTRFNSATALCAIALLASLHLSAAAAGDATVPHKETAAGQLTLQINPTADSPGRQEFFAVGHATHLGEYTQVGGHDFYLDGTLEGEFVTTAADGSSVAGIYYGTFEPVGDGIFRFDVIAEWLVGMGRLEGVSGIGEVTAFLDSETGAVEYVTDAEWTSP